MFVASYSNTMRGARPVLAPRRPMPLYGIRREWFPTPVPKASARELIAMVAAWHGLSYGDIIGRSRVYAIVRARQDAMAAVRYAYPHLSLPALAKHFKRDHTTVLHGLQKVGAATVLRKWGSLGTADEAQP